MRYERTAACGPGAPAAQRIIRLARAWYSTAPGGFPWNVPTSSAAVWPAPPRPARRPRSSRTCAVSTTRPAAAITCVNGSRVNRPRHLPSAASWLTCWWAVTMSPPNGNGPGVITPQGRPDAQLAATATPGTSLPSVSLRGRRHRYPVASASLYEPSCERTWWWISLRCPLCRSVHLHRVRQEQDAEGVRRTGCGRRVFVKVRTTYRSNATSGRAA